MLPAVLGIIFVADLAVTLVTGKDIIEHVTGVDVWAPIVDPVSDFIADTIVPDAGSAESIDWGPWFQSIQDNMDEWGLAIFENMNNWGDFISTLLYIVIAGIILLAILILIRTKSSKRYWR